MATPSVADKHSLHYKAMDTALDEWFGKFDGDHNGTLDREELTALLVHLHPDMPPPQASYVGLLPSEFEPPDCCPTGRSAYCMPSCDPWQTSSWPRHVASTRMRTARADRR